MQRLQRLTTEDYVYSTGCEEPQKKAEITTQSFVDQAKKNKENIRSIMNVPTFQMSCGKYSLHRSLKK